MYTINIRGKINPRDRQMVKLELVFFKTGYARVPKVLNITGLFKNWDAKSQCFKVGTPNATTKNKLLFDIRTKYLHIIDTWESEGRNWSPVELSHCFDELKQSKSEVKVKSVVQMIDSLILRFNEKKRIKNGQIVDSTTNAKKYEQFKRSLSAFTLEKYGKALSSYYFVDITEQFLLDYAFWIKENGIKNGKFTEDLLKLAEEKSRITAWDVYNVATELYKPGKTDFPAMIPQNGAFAELLLSDKLSQA